MSTTKDMTAGRPTRLLLTFAIPLMFGNLFQQLYTFVDALIVGKCVSGDALAAVSATEWLTFIMFGVISGITQGCSVTAAGYFGEKKFSLLKKTVYNGYLIAVLGAAGFTAAGQFFITPCLKLLRTPPEVIGMTTTYLRILYAAIPVTFFYNIFAALLRALGDSRKPFHAMTIASLANIVFDLFFILQMDMGVAGAACGTVLSQLLAALYCARAVHEIRQVLPFQNAQSPSPVEHEKPSGEIRLLRLTKEDRRPDRKLLKEQLKIGLPISMQNIITATGGLIVQATVNGFGMLFLTGYAAANKVYVLLETAASSYGLAILTYTAQNHGIDAKKRMADGLKAALLIGSVTALFMSCIMFFAGEPFVSLFIRRTESGFTDILAIGSHYLRVLALGFPLLYCLYILRAFLQGTGDSVYPMLSSIIQVIMRAACALLMTRVIGNAAVFWGELLAWAGADLFLCYRLILIDPKNDSRRRPYP